MSSHGSLARLAITTSNANGSGDAESKRGAGHNLIAEEAACKVTNNNNNNISIAFTGSLARTHYRRIKFTRERGCRE